MENLGLCLIIGWVKILVSVFKSNKYSQLVASGLKPRPLGGERAAAAPHPSPLALPHCHFPTVSPDTVRYSLPPKLEEFLTWSPGPQAWYAV